MFIEHSSALGPALTVGGFADVFGRVEVRAKQVANDSLEDAPDERSEKIFQANILAMFPITRSALRHLPTGAAIVNTTSIQAYEPAPSLFDEDQGR